MEGINNNMKEDLNASRLLPGEGNVEAPNRSPSSNRNVDNGMESIDETEFSNHYIQESFDKINDAISKIEGDKLTGITQELSYLRHVLDYQNTKIEKLTGLMADFLENKNQNAIISSLQAIQDGDNQKQAPEHEHMAQQVQGQSGDGDHDHDQVGDGSSGMPSYQESLANASVHLESNMDPQLHQVAAAAVQQAEEQAAQVHQPNVNMDKYRKKIYLKRKTTPEDPSASSPQDPESLRDSKRPKISIDFLHNPMTVKEIYDEFTKGFRGQPPLCEMDSRFGKHEWRGDSRSKESKRYQRRKKLCDSIARGMQKYDKSAEEIIRYIEEFRGDKSLTWVMNGNLPSDLHI